MKGITERAILEEWVRDGGGVNEAFQVLRVLANRELRRMDDVDHSRAVVIARQRLDDEIRKMIGL